MGVSRPILPPMPWHFYRNLTEEDLGSIYAYLRTIPPVHNRVPLPVPPETAFADRPPVASESARAVLGAKDMRAEGVVSTTPGARGRE
jgi:hypothetical protein